MKCIIVDIDGTLSIVGERRKCLDSDPKGWDAFYNRCDEDKPNTNIIDIVNVLSSKYTIILCSGRRESTRLKTMCWLRDNGLGDYKLLLLRRDGDTRSDSIVKPELIRSAKINYDDIVVILEDRGSMVRTWRKLGLTCIQVAEGK